MDVEIIGGDSMPPDIKEALSRALGGKKRPDMRPARLADIQELLKGAAQPKLQVGDIVVMRNIWLERYSWPKPGDRCIVTQVIDPPVRVGEGGTSGLAVAHDIALAFVDENDGELTEYLHDSRGFERVGSIYDPVTLANGETLPVE